MTRTEKALNTTIVKLYEDMQEAKHTAPCIATESPLRDRILMSMWSQQLSQMQEALSEWSWSDIYENVKKYGTISMTIFRHHDDADQDIWNCPDEVSTEGFDALWRRINETSLLAGHPSDVVEVRIEDIPEGESRLISHPEYPDFYLLVSMNTSVMYQSDDYFVHEYTIKHGGVPAEQQERVSVTPHRCGCE